MPMEDTYGIQSRIGSIIVVERWYCCRGSPVFSDRNIHEIATWVYGRKVNIDYHVAFEYNRYSCPYQYARKSVDLKVTDSTVEIYSGSASTAVLPA